MLTVQAEKPIRIFDGKTFKGWEGNMKYFRIEQGAVVAGNLKTKIPNNEFLCTKKTFKNFILKLDVKLGAAPRPTLAFRFIPSASPTITK